VYKAGHVVVQEWKRNTVFCSDWLSNDDLIDIIELIPVLVPTNNKQKVTW